MSSTTETAAPNRSAAPGTHRRASQRRAVRSRELHLSVNINDGGRHPAGWRAVSDPRAFLTLEHFQELGRVAERGTFDAILIPDGIGLAELPPTRPWMAIEPTIAMTAMAAVTTHVGFIGTASTTFNEPFNVARRFAAVDHISGGRAAWNIVTSLAPFAAASFGLDAESFPTPAARYRRAAEFVDVVLKLWSSWDDDALAADQATGTFALADGIHPVNHAGEHFTVHGPLSLPRTPQGRPVLVQAGASPEGVDLSARYADVVFTAATDIEQARSACADVKARAASYGRDPESIKYLPGLYAIVGGTEEEANQKFDALNDLLNFDHELIRVAEMLGLDPAGVRLDAHLPDGPTIDQDSYTLSRGFLKAAWDRAREGNPTFRELVVRNVTGHRQIVGAPEQIADNIQTWFEARAADGFVLNFTTVPDGLSEFVDHVVPILRKRGLFRSEYPGNTLRDSFGLAYPADHRS